MVVSSDDHVFPHLTLTLTVVGQGTGHPQVLAYGPKCHCRQGAGGHWGIRRPYGLEQHELQVRFFSQIITSQSHIVKGPRGARVGS